jgi:hypothetical protein
MCIQPLLNMLVAVFDCIVVIHNIQASISLVLGHKTGILANFFKLKNRKAG